MATRIGDELAERMGRELTRHVQTSDERNLDAIRTLDDQYRRLPGEVVALRDRPRGALWSQWRNHPGVPETSRLRNHGQTRRRTLASLRLPRAT